MLTIGFELEGEGRAVLVVATQDGVGRVAVSDASDPLNDLAQAVLDLLAGRREARFSTFDPPSEHLWHLEQVGRGAVRIEIVHAAACLDLDPGAPLNLQLRTICTLSEVGGALSRTLDTIARSHGVAGYEQMWATHRFPSEARRLLRDRLRRTP